MSLPAARPRSVPAKEKWVYYPTLNSSDEEVREYINRQIAPESHRRRYHAQRAALNLWFYLGRQWILPRFQLAPGNGVYHFAEVWPRSQAAFPRPVTNFIAPTVDNEVSRMGRKELVPDTNPGKNKPEWQAAAQLSKDILKWEMAKEVWGDKREELYMNLCVESCAILRTGWDENESELSLVASPSVVKCPNCGRLFSSRNVPRSFATLGMPTDDGAVEMRHAETLSDVPPQGEMSEKESVRLAQVQMSNCPFCEDAHGFEAYPISKEEATMGDAFGRQLGIEVPRGRGSIDPVSLHEYYPENGGIQIEPRDQQVFHTMIARPLEWVALRHPDFGDDIKPEAPQNLLRMNPLYAEPTLAGFMGYNLSVGPESFANHARFQEVVVLPQPHIAGLERGAIFWKMAAGTRVLRKPLMVEVKGGERTKYVPRIKYHFARFRRIPRNFWGRTFIDDLIPLQRRLNELDSQVQDLRERGKPTMYLPAGTTIADREETAGSMVYTEYNSPNPEWHPREAIFPGVPITGNPYFQERNQIMEDAQRLGYPQDIEVGMAPGSVKTTSGLMLISEEASQKRAPRERSMALLFSGAFSHILDMNWAFRKEEEVIEVMSEGGIYEEKSFTGTDLIGGLRVEVNARAGYDQTLYNKEAASEALDRGLYRADTPDAVDKLLDLLKLPKDVNEGSGIQVRRAEMAWTDFMREKKIPVPDYTAWDFPAWFAILLKRWMQDECLIMQEKVGFAEVWTELVTWEQKLALFDQMEMAAAPYKEVPEDQWDETYQHGQAAVQEAMDAYRTATDSYNRAQASGSEVNDGMGAPVPPPTPPPMTEFPPPPQVPFLPDALHLRIYETWRRMNPSLRVGAEAAQTTEALEKKPGRGTEAMLALDLLLQMRAVIEACRQKSIEMVMAQAPPPGPPEGGAEGPAGPPA